MIDINHRIIPNLINYPGAVLVFAVACIAQPDRIAEFAISGILCFLFLGTAWLISPRGMGLGDVKMALMIGLGTGRYAYVALLFGFIASTGLSAYLLLRFGAKARKATFPFGPFLAFGTEVALLWGPPFEAPDRFLERRSARLVGLVDATSDAGRQRSRRQPGPGRAQAVDLPGITTARPAIMPA